MLVQERLAGVERASEDLSLLHRKEISRLEAALAGAEAAKKNLTEQQAQHSTAGESDLQAAHAAQAEADARASSLQKQIDTVRAQAAASRSGLQDDANSLKVCEMYIHQPNACRLVERIWNSVIAEFLTPDEAHPTKIKSQNCPTVLCMQSQMSHGIDQIVICEPSLQFRSLLETMLSSRHCRL